MPGAFPFRPSYVPGSTSTPFLHDQQEAQKATTMCAWLLDRRGASEYSPETRAVMHRWLSRSAEADAFRQLRVGTRGYTDPYRLDLGRGILCECWGCKAERQQLRERRARAQRTYWHCGGTGVGRWGRGTSRRPRVSMSPQPRDSDDF